MKTCAQFNMLKAPGRFSTDRSKAAILVFDVSVSFFVVTGRRAFSRILLFCNVSMLVWSV